MKIRNRAALTMIPLLVCMVATAVYRYYFVFLDDRTPPEITMDADMINVSVSAGEEELLKGVSAFDKRDGDVTGKIIVESVANINDECTATVTYAAFDAAGNVSKAVRKVKFTDYEPPEFGLKQALVFQSELLPNVLDCLSAKDKVDGDISRNVKGTLISNTGNLSSVGTHYVAFRVTNSMGDTEHITLPVDVLSKDDYNSSVELSEYLVYTKRGEEFKPEEYLKYLIIGRKKYSLDYQNPSEEELLEKDYSGIPDAEREEEVRTYIHSFVDPSENGDIFIRIVNVEMRSNVNTEVPGVYSVEYTVTMDSKYVGFTRLNVVVED